MYENEMTTLPDDFLLPRVQLMISRHYLVLGRGRAMRESCRLYVGVDVLVAVTSVTCLVIWSSHDFCATVYSYNLQRFKTTAKMK
ncbi:hypothetical protein P692DRAFT_20466524 [Suillus brevipes Sb2]|nr:hypothetical protein P692DRAFT_20466524 [Suillus brevipes Sb2]